MIMEWGTILLCTKFSVFSVQKPTYSSRLFHMHIALSIFVVTTLMNVTLQQKLRLLLCGTIAFHKHFHPFQTDHEGKQCFSVLVVPFYIVSSNVSARKSESPGAYLICRRAIVE
ncbi:hypothetical protein TNCV_2607811 [Trichonephila clavipes]|uniref:Uncharacterized protein n=1 Tax=Trichonephila clavipes TaxID=2585209 RepID=A0A8X6V201_TRICX|nr:hypothetical protein TNCV_2607811 [Trichonephila clavipes]